MNFISTWSRISWLLLLLLAIACGDDDSVTLDGGASDSSVEDAAAEDASSIEDATTGDAMTVDSGVDDAGEDVGAEDSGGEEDAGSPPAAEIGLSFSGGCAPMFDGDISIVYSGGNLGISSVSGAGLTGSIQLSMDGASGTIALSSMHRVDSGQVVNVIAGTTWSNLAMDYAGVVSGTIEDPIQGSIVVNEYAASEGRIDLEFVGVQLQNPGDGSLCSIEGTLVTSRLEI